MDRFSVTLEPSRTDQDITDRLYASIRYEQEKLVLRNMEAAVAKQRIKVAELLTLYSDKALIK